MLSSTVYSNKTIHFESGGDPACIPSAEKRNSRNMLWLEDAGVEENSVLCMNESREKEKIT